MMNPGGTGRPRFVISERLAPLPPSRSFMSLLPWLKSYTNVGMVATLRVVSGYDQRDAQRVTPRERLTVRHDAPRM